MTVTNLIEVPLRSKATVLKPIFMIVSVMAITIAAIATIPVVTMPQIAKAYLDCSRPTTQEDRYSCGYKQGYLDAQRDWNLHRFPPGSGGDNSCPRANGHTFEYCNGYQVGYTASWNNLAKQSSQNPPSNPPPSNTTTQPPANANTTTHNPPGPSLPNPSPNPPTSPNTTIPNPHTTISSPTTDSWVAPFIIFVIVVLIIAAIARKLKHRRGKHKERRDFPEPVKEKVLERQHHRCADCHHVLSTTDWHHRNGNRSDNRESNCVALCPNCHADRTRRHN